MLVAKSSGTAFQRGKSTTYWETTIASPAFANEFPHIPNSTFTRITFVWAPTSSSTAIAATGG